MSSNVEIDVATIRADRDNLKTSFAAAVSRLEARIREMGATSERDLTRTAAWLESRRAEMREDIREYYQRLEAKIDRRTGN